MQHKERIMTLTSAVLATIGGILIGLASLGLLVFNGRIAGISGIVGGLLQPAQGDVLWRAMFVAGLVAGGIVLLLAYPAAFPAAVETSTAGLILAGVLVGVGTRIGSGCTSGHGVCGLSRFSPRSLVATLTFMAAGAVTVFIIRVAMGGAL
jgi:uncharacterized protein